MDGMLYFLILAVFSISIYVFIEENRGKKQMPSLLGWLVLALASILSLITFFVFEGLNSDSVMKAVMYVGNVLGTVTIVFFLTIQKNKNLSLTLNLKDKILLIGVVSTVLFWGTTRNAFVANILVQVLMAIGYLFFINAMVKTKKRLDSFLFWLLALLTTVLSLPLVEGSLLATINTWRSLVCISSVLMVMAYYEFSHPLS